VTLEILILGVSSFLTFMMALVVFTKNTASASNRLFSYLAALIAIEPIINFFSLHNDNHLLFMRLVMLDTVGIGLFFCWLAVCLIEGKFRLNVRRLVEVAATLVVGAIALSPYLFADAIISDTGNITPVVGPGMVLFVVHVAYFLIRPLIQLHLHARQKRGAERVQIQYIVLGIGTAAVLAFTSNFILPIIFKFSALVIFTPIYLSFFAIFGGIAIIRHRLFDVRLLIARSVAYVLLLTTLSALYGAAVFSLSAIFFPANSASHTELLLNTILAIGTSFTFQPLRRFFERITDNIFYRHRYDSQVVLNNFSKVLVSELDLQRLLKRALGDLCESLHIEFGQIIVYNQEHVYRIEHYGPLPRRLMIAPELAKLNKPMLIADELPEGERKKLLEGHGVRVSLSLRTREEFVGYLLLGDKLSGDIYSGQDVELLEIISKELAVAILNAKSYAEIQDFTVHLQARIERATKRLRVANRHLKELDRAKDEFISMASHQLRTPLTTIKGYLSMMLEGDAGHLSKAQKDFVGYAFGSSERMVNLISDLLNVSRLQAGRFLIQTKPTDLVKMIRDEIRQLEEHAKSKHITLKFDLPAEPLPLVEIDENKTRQVIMNFIDNAIYYTQVGGVTVVLQQAGTRVRFEVRDTGIGVPAEARKKLFTKFYRAGNAQTVRPDGTGLGLYLAKRVVEDQGGTIIFESVEGEGSTFGFELPYKPVGKADTYTAKPQKSAKREHASVSSTK
jgi:signal transduction histidine kinase